MEFSKHRSLYLGDEMVNAVEQSRDFDIDPFLGDLDDSQSVASAVSTTIGVNAFLCLLLIQL
jgi:hypothetical protein